MTLNLWAARLQVMQLSQYNAVGDVEQSCERVMTTLLEMLRQHYNYIIIDCGLKHELLTVNALAASDYCIIPVQVRFNSTSPLNPIEAWQRRYLVLTKKSMDDLLKRRISAA